MSTAPCASTPDPQLRAACCVFIPVFGLGSERDEWVDAGGIRILYTTSLTARSDKALNGTAFELWVAEEIFLRISNCIRNCPPSLPPSMHINPWPKLWSRDAPRLLQGAQQVRWWQISALLDATSAILRAGGSCKIMRLVAPVGEDRGLPHSGDKVW